MLAQLLRMRGDRGHDIAHRAFQIEVKNSLIDNPGVNDRQHKISNKIAYHQDQGHKEQESSRKIHILRL